MESNEKRADEVYCSSCGSIIKKDAELCVKCGVRNSKAKKDQRDYDNSRIIAAVLALFLGGIGIHKFYLGQIGMGIIYLLFSWTFIPGIIAFIECIIYLTTSDESFQRKYVKN